MNMINRGIYPLIFVVLFTCAVVNASSSSSIPSSTTTSMPTSSLANESENEPTAKINETKKEYKRLKEEVIFKRWRSIISRVVQMPNGNVVDYDIVDQKGVGAVVVFVWNSKTKTATLVREYNPGCHRILYGVAAGIIESDAKHAHGDPKQAAIMELEEECHLSGGTWYSLTTPSTSHDDDDASTDDSNNDVTPTGVPMDKYAITNIVPYLVIDATHVHDPKPCDDEEDIEIVRDVTIDEILLLIRNGEMNLVGGWSCLLAIEKLRELGEIV